MEHTNHENNNKMDYSLTLTTNVAPKSKENIENLIDLRALSTNFTLIGNLTHYDQMRHRWSMNTSFNQFILIIDEV